MQGHPQGKAQVRALTHHKIFGNVDSTEIIGRWEQDIYFIPRPNPLLSFRGTHVCQFCAGRRGREFSLTEHFAQFTYTSLELVTQVNGYRPLSCDETLTHVKWLGPRKRQDSFSRMPLSCRPRLLLSHVSFVLESSFPTVFRSSFVYMLETFISLKEASFFCYWITSPCCESPHMSTWVAFQVGSLLLNKAALWTA